MSKEPTRLMQSEPGPLADEIAALRARLPSPERMAALTERLTAAGARIEPPMPRAPRLVEPQRQPAVRALDSSAKLVGIALLAGGALIGAALSLRRSDESSRPPAARVAPAPSAPGSAGPAAVVATKSATNGAPSRTVPASPASAIVTAPSAAFDESSTASPTSAPSAARPVPETASVATASAAPSRERRSDSARAERGTARSTASPSSNDEASSGRLADNTVVPSEVDMLKEARSALSADPARAFALTERCRAQYPSGSFAQEREFIAISALYRMGRGEEARSRLSLFKMHYPSSAYLPALSRLLGEP